MLLSEARTLKAPKSCPLRSSCRREADGRFVKGLFSTKWVAFVIRHDPAEDKYRGFTICCESVTGSSLTPGAHLNDCA